MPEVAWLTAATSYRKVDGGWQLLDGTDDVVANLAVDGAPRPDPNVAEFYAEPPKVTDGTREALRTAAPLPISLVAATDDALTGRWVPVAYAVATDPHVQFMKDGTWKGSDGCNRGGGRWTVGSDGEFLATSGPTTLIGCEGAPVPSWVAQATTAGFDQDWLLPFNAAGNEIGRLKRP